MQAFRLAAVTDAGVEAVCRQCPRLRVLSIRRSYITDAALTAIGGGAAFAETLETLDLTGNVRMTGESLGMLHGLPSLRHLVLRACPRLADAGVRALASPGCPPLATMTLTANMLTTDTVVALGNVAGPTIEKLIIRGGRRLDRGRVAEAFNESFSAAAAATSKSDEAGTMAKAGVMAMGEGKAGGGGEGGAGMCIKCNHKYSFLFVQILET